MIVETSAIGVLFLDQNNTQEKDQISDALAGADSLSIAFGSLIEAYLLVWSRNPSEVDNFLEFFRFFNISIIGGTWVGAEHAFRAVREHARGNNIEGNAKLNFGDIISYATAMETGEPLLFKGKDFPKTDVKIADGSICG